MSILAIPVFDGTIVKTMDELADIVKNIKTSPLSIMNDFDVPWVALGHPKFPRVNKKKLKKLVLAAGDKGGDDESEEDGSDEDSEDMSEELDEDEEDAEGSDEMDEDKSGSESGSDKSGSDSPKKKSKEPEVKQPGFKISKGGKPPPKPQYAQTSRK